MNEAVLDRSAVLAPIFKEPGLEIAAFDIDQAYLTAKLRSVTRAAGLPLGERACLALSRRLGLPAVTARRSWRQVPDFDVVPLRGE